MFGLGVELDYIFEPKWLINELSLLDYAVSYDEVTKFKQNSILFPNFENILPKYSDSITQWVVDNANHNVCTLDSKDTFHGIGVIFVSASTVHQQNTVLNLPVQCLKNMKA